MDLDYIFKTDAYLWKHREDQDTNGKECRREIQRRKLIGYCDGTAINRGTDAMGNPKANPYAR
tara:strand:- start:20872 stop:21060 length:189 start_codon:yes stop_codon:yes gene_type:complete